MPTCSSDAQCALMLNAGRTWLSAHNYRPRDIDNSLRGVAGFFYVRIDREPTADGWALNTVVTCRNMLNVSCSQGRFDQLAGLIDAMKSAT